MTQDDWITGNIKIRIGGVPMEFNMTVPAAPVKPHRMLPIFQQMANSMVAEAVKEVELEGKTISCKAHCGACCRQAVPISEAEAYRISEMVEAMPEPQKTQVKERFEHAAAHFNKIGWYERFGEHLATAGQRDRAEAEPEGIALAIEYFDQGIPCPFLEDESCSIHPDRPLTCREYLVTSPAENCAEPAPNKIDMVKLPLKPSRFFNRVVRTENLGAAPYLILSQALEFVKANPEKFPDKTGSDWVKDFFTELSGKQIPEAVSEGKD